MTQDHDKTPPTASQDGPRQVAATPQGLWLPPHMKPLFESIERNYDSTVGPVMREELAHLCRTKWKGRVELWAAQHPLKNNQVRACDIPPIVFDGNGFAWVTRRERRMQER